jgi:hypothetical protein
MIRQYICALSLVFLFCSVIMAQKYIPVDTTEYPHVGKHLCATEAPSYEQNKIDLGNFTPRNKNAGYTQLPMHVHIVQQDNGTGGVSLDVINRELANLNHAFEPEQIEWYIATINYINNTNLYNFDTSEEDALANGNQLNTGVNVFWVNSISFGSGGACGYAYFPFNSTTSLRILMDKDCAGGVWWDTFVHEFGHHLNLYHTHQGTSSGNTHPDAEHVPRTGSQSNCGSTGDLLCDTEADPTGPTSGCVYNGGGTDIYNNPYTPDEDNIMSYYADACGGALFTPGQYTRINTGLSARLGHSAYDIDGAPFASVTDPSGLCASTFLASITLSWIDNSNNETGFVLERSMDGVNFIAMPYLGVGPNTTTVTDSYNINPNTTYYYRVKASNDNPDHYSNIISITTGAAIDNFTCATAASITCGTYNSPGPSQGNGATQSDATHAVWYEYIPSGTGTLDISSCLGGTDTRVWVYEGSCANLTLVASNDDTCEMTPGSQLWAADLSNIPITQGVPLYIEWDNKWSSNGFSFSASCDCPPDHNLAGAQTSSADFETNGSIQSSQIISGTAVTVDYDSGSSISLNPGFSTANGVQFRAFIDGCGGAQ